MTCEVEGCARPAVARGVCDMHRARRARGIPDDRPVQRQVTRAQIAERLPEMIAMREAGASFREIAARVGMHPATVSRALRGVAPPPVEIPHGRPSAWQYHKCRCDICTRARRAYKRRERDRQLAAPTVTAEHGTILAYRQGCRCPACMRASAGEMAARQARTVQGAYRHGAAWTSVDAETALRPDLTIEEKAALLGRTHAAVDNWIRAYQKRPDDPFQVK